MTPGVRLQGKLAKQLTLGIMTAVVVTSVMAMAMLLQLQRGILRQQVADLLVGVGQDVIDRYERVVLQEGRLVQFQQELESIASGHVMIEAVGVLRGNRVEAMWERSQAEEGLVDASARATLASLNVEEFADSPFRYSREHKHFEALLPIQVEGETLGWVCLMTGEHVVSSQVTGALGRIAVVVLSVFTVLGAALFMFLRGVVTRPMHELAGAANLVARGHLGARVPVTFDNEIGTAGSAVNAMADHLITQSESLRASEARYRTLLQSGSEAWFVIDSDSGCIVEVNGEASNMLGITQSEIVGRSVTCFVAPEDREVLRELRAKVEALRVVHGCELLRMLRVDGTFFPVSLNARLLHLGSETLIFASVRDISDQIRANEEIRRQLRRVTALNAVSRACSQSLEPQRILQAISEQVRESMPCDAFTIQTWDEAESRLCAQYLIDTALGDGPICTESLRGRLVPGSPADRVIRNRESIRIHREETTEAVEGTLPFGDGTKLSRSLLFVPLVANDRVIGVMSAQSYECHAYSQDDLDLLRAMGNQVGLVLSNANMHESTTRSLATRESLNHIAKAIGATFDLRRIAEIVYDEICNLIGFDAFYMNVLEADLTRDRVLMLVDTIDGKRQILPLEDFTRPLSEKHAHEIATTREAHLELRAPQEIPDRPYVAFGDVTRRSSSLMFAPMSVGDRVIGVLSVQSYSLQAFTHDDLMLLQEIADLAALALESARLYNEVATSEARHRALVESANVSIILTDLMGQIVMWNRGSEQVFGHTAEDALESKLEDMFVSGTMANDRISKLLSRHGSWTAEGQAKHRDGTQREVVFSVARVTDGDGSEVGRVIITSDMTEKKTLERALLQAQKMESIGTLAGGIAHDFNNLLTGILGYASYLQSQAEPGTRLARDLDQIERAAKRASELTSQLLAFSRKQMICHQPVNLNEVIDETLRMMERTLGKHIRIEADKELNLHIVEADPTQMQQVLMNLAINARDAMGPEGGVLSISTRNVTADAEFCQRHPEITPGPHVKLVVSDTGMGMDEETVSRIFDPFFTTKEVGEGTGLGLAMVYGIVRSHGGLIQASSTLGLGTTFGVYLPIGDEAQRADDGQRSEESDVRGGNETILLVDDEPVILRLGASILERYGYTVLSAPSGAVALNLHGDHMDEIDLVVLDMVMPEMNGAELAKRLRERDPNCRILLSSGYTLDHDAEVLLQSGGMIGFLPKPYRMSQLVHHVRRALDQPVMHA